MSVVTTPPRAPVTGRAFRTHRFSLRVDRRSVVCSVALLVATLAIACWSVSTGDFSIPISDVVTTLIGAGSDDAEFIVQTLRLPRALTAVLVGAAFAIAGGIFQSLAQNPLASPDLVGFNAGSALGAVFAIVSIDDASSALVSVGAVAGGLATAALVYLLAWKRGVHGYRLILVGLGVGFTASAAVDFLLTRAQIYDVQRAAVWLTGSLNGRGWQHVRPLGSALAVLLPLAAVLGRQLRLLELGADAAAALGVRVGRTRLALVLIGVTLASLATAASGPIAFIALVSPPIARRLVRSPGFAPVPTALVGALLTLSADLAARRSLAPTELPVGIATAVIGAPYLLWLMTRETRSGAM